jgi:3-carboxy-cis,cis-muconate cycloisomerase
VVAPPAPSGPTSGVPLRDILLADPDLEDKLTRAGITQADIEHALDPAGYLGAAAEFTDAALAAHEDVSW